MKSFMNRIPRDDSCPNCKNDRCVEIFDLSNKPINYTVLLDKLESINGISKIDLSNIAIKNAMCQVCGKIYQIDWNENLKIPRPFYLTELKNIILDEYFNK